MCSYYAHAFSCNHVTFSFARFCDPSWLIQTRCGDRHIWQTISMDESCEDCKTSQYIYAESARRRSRRR
ncbi:hypothetical protein QBC42DRAFT_187732 [Cladorrhinum samala]|uniref:Uncharacterized protein n=1 Tax=Cladorrhinum samala TaxID=585594 RepID=A0AAV9H9Q8_9PEZI|nr:hypothetical protein QBC42DRAFT_187732 [Cladorrhinum samala]